MSDDGFKILTGFFVGALGGLLAGILIAPESGKEIRKRISDTANKFSIDLNEIAEETLTTTKKRVTEAINDLVKGSEKKDTEGASN